MLRVDDPGAGGSTGGSAKATTFDFATDVQASVAWLRQRPEVDPKRVGLIGHSEGGIIAPMVASQDPSIAFIVLWAGPGVSGMEVLAEQVRAIDLAAGAPPAAAEAASKLQRGILQALISSSDPAVSRAAMDKQMVAAHAPPLDDRSFGAMDSPWYRGFVAYDPAPALRKLRIPVLAVVGGKDTQVTAAQNIPALRAALASDPKAEVVELPGLNHMLQPATTGSVDEYGKIETTIDPAALKLITDWVSSTSRAGG